MAIGLPVITSDCGGMKEIINNGKNGFYFPAPRTRCIKKTLIKVMNFEFAERKNIIIEGKKFINKNFDLELIKSKYHNFYKKEMEVKR